MFFVVSCIRRHRIYITPTIFFWLVFRFWKMEKKKREKKSSSWRSSWCAYTYIFIYRIYSYVLLWIVIVVVVMNVFSFVVCVTAYAFYAHRRSVIFGNTIFGAARPSLGTSTRKYNSVHDPNYRIFGGDLQCVKLTRRDRISNFWTVRM